MGRFHPLRETVEKNELFLKELFKNPSLTVILSEIFSFGESRKGNGSEEGDREEGSTCKGELRHLQVSQYILKWPYSSLMSVNKTDNRLKQESNRNKK